MRVPGDEDQSSAGFQEALTNLEFAIATTQAGSAGGMDMMVVVVVVLIAVGAFTYLGCLRRERAERDRQRSGER